MDPGRNLVEPYRLRKQRKRMSRNHVGVTSFYSCPLGAHHKLKEELQHFGPHVEAFQLQSWLTPFLYAVCSVFSIFSDLKGFFCFFIKQFFR